MSFSSTPSTAEIGLHAMRLVRDRICTDRTRLIAKMREDFRGATEENITAAVDGVLKFLPPEPDVLQLHVGGVYRSKRPAGVGSVFHPVVNDRQIIWIGAFELQYDSPSVKLGQRHPRMSISDFHNWAAKDVTAEMPKDDWASWRGYQEAQTKAKEEAQAAKAAAKTAAKEARKVAKR